MESKDKLLAEAGNAEAQFELGQGYLEYDPEKAKMWLVKAACQGHGQAMMELGSLAYREENFKEAEKWWQLASHDDEWSGDALVCLQILAKEEEVVSLPEFLEHPS